MTRALVTGAGKRLGRILALELACQGYDVAVHYAQSAQEAEAVADEIKALGQQAMTLQADLLDKSQTNALIDRAATALGGPLQVLVNNASIFEKDAIGSITDNSWDRHFDSNLRAPVALTQTFAAQAPEPETDAAAEPLSKALVINMIDQRVLHPTPDFTSYTLAKSALWTFTQTAAQALAPKIRVNAIAPGPTLQSIHQTDADFHAERRATLLRRGANPDDIAQTLRYFLNAPAVTGQMLCVDGGQHLGR